MRLEGKTALITGASRNIGREVALTFAREGADLILNTRSSQAELDEVAGMCRELGVKTHTVIADVSDSASVSKMVEEGIEALGKIDVLVNNAGITIRKNVEDTTEEDWDRIMAINAKGVFLWTKQAIPAMRESGGGSIVNISSTAGLVGSPYSGASYAATKGAVRLFTKATAIQYAKEGIRCNSVHPGLLETPMTQDMLADAAHREERTQRIPLGRAGTAEDVAYGVLYLASDESSFVTGSELVIDGGATAQ